MQYLFLFIFKNFRIIFVNFTQKIKMVPLAGIEPAHSAPEADALSTELQGSMTIKIII